ncbi:MAG: hypothetical protein Q4A00_02700 [Flavobacteriaceae bacterium]|nr:hypothetical protein [Flavobacteriaceae bacterium]
MRSILGIVLTLTMITITAQQGNVGINTATPTENLDIKGTLRVRELPENGSTNTIYTTGPDTSSATKTGAYNSTKIVVTDANGVLGVINDEKDLLPNNTIAGFNAEDDSTSMFVVKRYTVTNAQTKTQAGFDTGMSVDKWEAIISGWMFKFTSNSTANHIVDILRKDTRLGFRLKSAGTWKIIGDIERVEARSEIDVLFIKKAFVAAEDRTQ